MVTAAGYLKSMAARLPRIPAGLDAFRAAHEVLVSEGALAKPGTPAR
jgi:hypothetical protein